MNENCAHRFLLPFERHLRGQSGKAKGNAKKSPSASESATEDSEKEQAKSPQKSPEAALQQLANEETATAKEGGETGKPAEVDPSKKIEVILSFWHFQFDCCMLLILP